MNPATLRHSRLSHRLDDAQELLLAGLLAAMPLAFGVVHAWSQMAVAAVSVVLLVCLLIKHGLAGAGHPAGGSLGGLSPWLLAPLPVWLGYVYWQTVPLPAGLVHILAPATWQLNQALVSPPDPARMTLSLYPGATLRSGCLALTVAAVFLAALDCLRSERRIRRMLWTIALSAAMVILLALAQDMAGNGKLYWRFDAHGGHDRSGPFVNHSHFSQYMNVSLGAALGLLLITLNGLNRTAVSYPAAGSSLHAWIVRITSPGAGRFWFLLTLLVLGVATVFLSLSRGGMISLLGAGGVTGLLLAVRRDLRRHASLMLLVTCLLLMTVLYVGFDAVYDRFASLGDSHTYRERIDMVRDTLPLAGRFWLTGSGLGTFAVVYPMADTGSNPARAAHLENDYLQLFLENGVIGLLLLLPLAGWVLASLVRCLKAPVASVQLAGYGLGFGLVAILIANVTDFGQRLLGNGCLTAVVCALTINLARLNRPGALRGRWLTHWVWLGVLASLTLASVMATGRLAGGACAEKQWRQAQALERSCRDRQWRVSPDIYRELTGAAGAALRSDPDHLDYRYGWNLYRWQALRESCRGHVIDRAFLETVRGIVADLLAMSRVCPTYGYNLLLAGQLQTTVLPESLADGEKTLLTARALMPAHPQANGAAGRVHLRRGELDEALACYKQFVALDGPVEEVIGQFCERLDRPDLAVMVAQDHPLALYRVLSDLDDRFDRAAEPNGGPDLLARAREYGLQALRRHGENPAISPSMLAALAEACHRRGQLEPAARYYRQALARRYNQLNWHLALAHILAELGQVDEAMKVARSCMKQWPDSRSARQLVGELSLKLAAHS